MNKRRGIVAAGNWIVDHQKIIDAWPSQDTLANILSESCGNGGAPYNLLRDLANLGAEFPLVAVGFVGDDSDGLRIRDDCARCGIDVSRLFTTKNAATSYTDVMTDRCTGRRTFFHNRGANALLSKEHFDFAGFDAKIFHLGYLLLLDSLDRIECGRPVACEVFARARAAGMLVSLDCVSENSGRFASVVRPALADVDILFANDFEAERLSGIRLRDGDGKIIRKSVEASVKSLLLDGVREWAIVHFPEAALARSPDGTVVWQDSVKVPESEIKGSAGAGDAFAAGVLYALHENWDMRRAMKLGVSVAAASLFDASCSDGVGKVEKCLALAERFGFMTKE